MRVYRQNCSFYVRGIACPNLSFTENNFVNQISSWERLK